MDEIQEVSPKRLTVLILSWDCAPQTERCVAALDFNLCHALVIDNGSRSGLVMPDEVTMLRLPKHFGFVKAANIGLRSVSTEFVLFLSSAVEIKPGALEALIAAFDANPEVPALALQLLTPSGQPAAFVRALPTSSNLHPSPQAIAPTQTIPVEYPGIDALALRFNFLKGMHLLDWHYDESWADAELAFQIRGAGKKILLLPNALGTLHADCPPGASSSLLEADAHRGAVTYLGKHFGWFNGFAKYLTSLFGALFSLKFGVFGALLTSQKIDGSHN
jgi:N-acetylglucosaminyl-diphospho-decaprenol L-rhamnosyltransferase